ncbi:MAG: hypothetical protein DRJ64_05315 [Thermoprotei archaeon]|nr:MAG: hypothetical protein DRJ64_05315 [Thermoprotei archaeon]
MKKEVKKQVGVIRVSNPVGLLSRKAWNVLLVNAYDELLNKNEHSISVKVLSDAIGFNSKDVKTLKNALQKLQTTLVEWDLGDQSKSKGVSFKSFASVQMLGAVEIKNNKVIYDFHPKLKQILYNPILYQKIGIAQQKVFHTSYGLYLWENCLRYINIGNTGFSTVEEWRKLLGATAKSYSVYKKFKSSVLNPAIKEINNLSNIKIELKTKRTGRKISHIGFSVEENKQKLISISDGLTDIKNSLEYRKLKEFSIEEIQAITLIQEYGYQYINEKIDLLKEQKKLDSPSGFLLNAIEKDWKDSSLKSKKERQKQEKEKQEKATLMVAKKKKIAEKDSENKKEKIKEIEEFLEIVGGEILEKINTTFIKKYKSSIHIGKHLKLNTIDLTNSAIKFNYYEFIYSHYMVKASIHYKKIKR